MNETFMKEKPIFPLLLGMGMPMVLSMLVNSLYNIVDQIFIGQGVGMLGNAATNIAFPVSIICTATALLLGIGSASNYNLETGKGNVEEANKIAGTGIFLSICIYVVFFSFFLLFSCIFIFSSIFFDFILFLETHRRFSPTTCFTVLRTVLFPSDHRSFKAFAKTFWLFSGRRLFAFISSCTAFHLLW